MSAPTPVREHAHQLYVGGAWVDPIGTARLEHVDPRTEEVRGWVAAGDADDVDRAVRSASHAFEQFSTWSVTDRLSLLDAVIAEYKRRSDDLVDAITSELGAPRAFAASAQVPAGLGHLVVARKTLAEFEFETVNRSTLIRREPIGVCALITPWNWPLNQITSKLGAALATGCTVVLKPSELAPLDAVVLAEVLDAAGVPPGVFNLVHGDGPTVGAALAAHPDVAMISITGSTIAGGEVARLAAPTIKRVVQELGGKSADIVLDDADVQQVIARDVAAACSNAGQSCAAGTRIFIPRSRADEAEAVAAATASGIAIGDDGDPLSIGPVVSRRQYDRVQGYIESGISSGARLVAGGPGRPPGFDVGHWVRPTVFTDVTNDMPIARDEIFGPVVVLIAYDGVDEAVAIANDSPYGLSGYVSSGDHDRAVAVAKRMRTGMVHVNGAPPDIRAPFGGVKASGNGREWGEAGFAEFLELKSIFGGAC
jgi:aldehyde dehydrogenase (NAD+)